MLFEDFFKVRGEFVNLDLTLDRITNALNDSSFSEKNIGTIIHIAGTNGKGSTAYFLSQLLEKQNLKVGLFTSPHIINITERIQIDRTPICRKYFDVIFDNIRPHIDKHQLSYFETLTMIGLKWFEQNRPDITIIETGLGGKYDASNVINNKIPVITRISQDHTKYLGNNIYNIIDEKLGILKENNTFFLGENIPFITEYILKNHESNHHIKQLTPEELISFKNQYIFPFNENAALANKIAQHITGKDNSQSILKLPLCRFEKIGNIIFDGAHNADGLLRILSNIKKKISVVISFTEERDAVKLINILKEKALTIYLTELHDNTRSINIDTISYPNIIKIKDPEEALNKAIENNNGNDILVTGSLYLCAYLRNIIIKGHNFEN